MNMKKKLLPVLLASSLFSLGLLSSCESLFDSSTTSSSQDTSFSLDEDAEVAYAYCSRNYNAGSGYFGRFDLTLVPGYSFTDLSDLSSITLSEAFSGMTTHSAGLSENDEETVIFYLTGALEEGDYGLISGTGLIQDQDVSIRVLIDDASASSNDILYNGVEEQTLTINLVDACFDSENISLTDFTLSGSLEDMTVESFVIEDPVYEEGEEFAYLPSSITLTLSGDPDRYNDVGYVTIANSATTYKEDLLCIVETAYRGGTVINDYIDTYTLEEIVFVESSNLHFVDDIEKSAITLGGAFEDYATITDVSVISETLVSISLSFPHTFVTTSDALASFTFDSITNTEGVAFTSYGYVETPEINFTLTQNNRLITLDFTLDHEEFNLLDTYPFSLYQADGTEVIVSSLETVNIDGNLHISFQLPEDVSGLFTFILENAYDVVNQEGETVDVTIEMTFYLDE